MVWPFKKSKALCTRDDIRFLHLLCLGREPNHESEYLRFEDVHFFVALKSLVSGRDFIRGVLEPLMLGKSLAYLPYTDDQQHYLKHAFKTHFADVDFQIETRTKALQHAAMWPRFLRAIDTCKFPFTVTEFAKKITLELQKSPPRISGKIEELQSNYCSGYAFHIDRPNESLQLDFYINGTFVGTTVADAARGDVAEEFNVSGYCGFRHTLHLPPHLASIDQLTVSVFDHASNSPACPPRDFPNVGVPYLPHLVKLTKALEMAKAGTPALSAAVDDICNNLPAIQQYSAIPLESYSIYPEVFAPPPAPSVEGQPRPLQFSECQHLQGANNAQKWLQYAATQNPNAVLFFTDFEKLGENGQLLPVFKSGFDYDELLTRSDYASAFAVCPDALAQLGADITKPHDLWLRIYEKYGDAGFHHIPHILFRVKPEVQQPVVDEKSFILAVQQHFDRCTIGAAINTKNKNQYSAGTLASAEITWPIDKTLPKLSIIIPMRDALSLTRNCLESVQATLKYPNATEIILVDNGSIETETKTWLQSLQKRPGIKVIDHDAPFNWAEINNLAVEQANAEYLLFLNNDTVALDKHWDHILRGYLHRKDIGAIGARLLFEDGTVQHAGVILNEVSLATHEGHGQSPDQGGYNNRTRLPHQCAAVTGAFLACTRDTFDKIEGFDALNFAVAFNDIDFCLKLLLEGLKILYVPAITFSHLESKSRGYDALNSEKELRAKAEHKRMKDKWSKIIGKDPFYPAHFLAQGFAFSYLAVPKKSDLTS